MGQTCVQHVPGIVLPIEKRDIETGVEVLRRERETGGHVTTQTVGCQCRHQIRKERTGLDQNRKLGIVH